MSVFKVVRLGGPRGRDCHEHLFCVVATGHPELVKSGDSHAEAFISGGSSSDPKMAREAAEKLCANLNKCMQDYLDGNM